LTESHYLAPFFAQSRGRLSALSAEAEGDGAAPACVALVDPRNQRRLAFRLARQGFLQHLDNVARRQKCELARNNDPLRGFFRVQSRPL
jgi:hypothetical protein